MGSITKFLLVHIVLAMLSILSAAETVFVPQNSLLFKSRKGADVLSSSWDIQALINQDSSFEVIKKEKVFLNLDQGTGIFTDACYLKIPGTDGLCYFPEVRFRKGFDGSIIPRVDKIDSLMFLGIFLIVAGLSSMAFFFHLKTEKRYYFLPVALVLFFWGYASWYVGLMSNSIIAPSDELFYYEVARKLLDGDFISMKFRYLLGFPVFCIPIILLCHVTDNLEFVRVYMNFQTVILIPGLFLLLYRFFYKKFGISRMQSFCILVLWLLMMIFYMPTFGAVDPSLSFVPSNYSSNANFSCTGSIFNFSFFQCTWLGRNALSDYAAFFLLILLLYVSMKKSLSLLRFFVLSMGFGFLCLVRVNYILFAPLLALVFYDSFSELWKDKRNYLYAILCGAAGFMAVFIWQLVLNKIQFGSPLVGPYSLHKYGPDRGFAWDVIPYAFKFLFQTNYVYLILGLSSFLFLPQRKIRVLMTLWIFPQLFFFIGYPGIFQHPTRFIFALFPLLTAAMVLNPVWQAAWPVRIKAALVVFSSCLLCKSNIFFTYFQPWNLGKYGLSNLDVMVIQGLVCLFCCGVIVSMRKNLRTDYANTIRPFRFLIVFTAVFFLGSVCIYIAGLLVLAALVYGLRDTWADIRQIWGKNAALTDDPRSLGER